MWHSKRTAAAAVCVRSLTCMLQAAAGRRFAQLADHARQLEGVVARLQADARTAREAAADQVAHWAGYARGLEQDVARLKADVHNARKAHTQHAGEVEAHSAGKAGLQNARQAEAKQEAAAQV